MSQRNRTRSCKTRRRRKSMRAGSRAATGRPGGDEKGPGDHDPFLPGGGGGWGGGSTGTGENYCWSQEADQMLTRASL